MKTDKQITLRSLKKIYKELPKLAETVPSIISDFDMREFGVYHRQTQQTIKNNECGTQGCGLGNAARLFKLVKSDFTETGKFNYYRFGLRILPTTHTEEKQNKLWGFLFSALWDEYQPTFKQFIERVKYAIDMDLEVGEWEYTTTSFIASIDLETSGFKYSTNNL